MKLAHCDLDTGEIYGCEKGSKKWWHEKGHFIFNKDPFYSFIILIRGYLKDIWLFFLMCSIVYKELIIITFILWFFYFSIFIYEELWCDSYSRLNFTNKNI